MYNAYFRVFQYLFFYIKNQSYAHLTPIFRQHNINRIIYLLTQIQLVIKYKNTGFKCEYLALYTYLSSFSKQIKYLNINCIAIIKLKLIFLNKIKPYISIINNFNGNYRKHIIIYVKHKVKR